MRTLPQEIQNGPERMKRIMVLLLEGKQEKEIAETLSLSIHVVHMDIKSIYRRCGVYSRPTLMAMVMGRMQERLLHLEPPAMLFDGRQPSAHECVQYL